MAAIAHALKEGTTAKNYMPFPWDSEGLPTELPPLPSNFAAMSAAMDEQAKGQGFLKHLKDKPNG